MINLNLIQQCSSLVGSAESSVLNLKLSICTDNRKYQHPQAFVAIPGAKVNPLDLIGAQLDQGLPVVFFEHNEVNLVKVQKLKTQYPKSFFVPVKDSVLFLQEISHYHIREWKKMNPRNVVFAISGSNGKTTHKEMLSHILNQIIPGKVVATEKNNNNHLGVPLTLLNVTHETQVVVLELGSNHPGEIKVLCDIAEPNAGLTTNIGATHLEFFGGLEDVFLEEGYLYHAVKKHISGPGFYLINTDDEYLARLESFPQAVTYGSNANAEAVITYPGKIAQIKFENKVLEVTNDSITGKHNKLNLITTSFIATKLYPEFEEKIIAAAASFKPTKNRSEWMQVNQAQVYLDAYNANPSSMKAALDGFKDYLVDNKVSLDQACIVLGDMNELGEHSAQYHQEVASFVKDLGFQNVYFVGRFRADYLKGHQTAHGKESAAAFKQEFRENILNNYRFHFIKGSRSLQLESLFDIT